MAVKIEDVTESKLQELQGKVIGDVAGSMGLLLAYVGDKLDLYSALAEISPATSQELADSTGVYERYVREWLSANAAAGYVNYDPASSQFSMTPEQAMVFAAKEYPGENYDLVAIFDALHDMGDPVGACRHVANSLSDDGRFMLVEPFAGDSLEENMHPLAQIYYAFSTMICLPASRSQEIGLGLGAQAGQKRLTEVLKEGGFGHVRRAAETPTNMVLEARV